MMQKLIMIIFRYLSKEIIYLMLAVWLIFLCVFLSTQLAIYLQKMAEGQLATSVLMQLIATFIPILTGLLLPMSFFVAVLLGLGRMYAESEMTVLYACGMSKWRLLSYVMILAIIVTMLVAVLTLWITPKLTTYQKYLLARSASSNLFETIAPGRFQEAGNGKEIFYVENIAGDRKSLENLFMASQDATSPAMVVGSSDDQAAQRQANILHEWDVIYAKQAHQQYEPDKGGHFLVSNNGYRYIGKPGEADFLIIKYGTYAVRVPSAEEAINISQDERSMSVADLLARYHQYKNYAAELQWRISIPLQTLILALLAVPLSRTRPRQGRYKPLLPAVLIYLVYANVLFAAREWVKTGTLNIYIGMWWIHILLFLVAIYLFITLDGWRSLLPRKTI